MNQQYLEFSETVWDYYAKNSRSLPWREPDEDGEYNPYKILVSEVMLQQTQVSRVIPKYKEFLLAFPDVPTLADTELSDVIRLWQGLGYNRRAKFLHLSAQKIMKDFGSRVPDSIADLESLPGIGNNTAAAVYVYAYNKPAYFVETNIRSVYIHHFFNDADSVDDKDILAMVKESIQLIMELEEQPGGVSHCRDWYWALMDYGTYLKSTVGNVSRKSKGYKKQSTFEGSQRQIRGKVLRYLADAPHTYTELNVEISDERLANVLKNLQEESLIRQVKDTYSLG